MTQFDSKSSPGSYGIRNHYFDLFKINSGSPGRSTQWIELYCRSYHLTNILTVLSIVREKSRTSREKYIYTSKFKLVTMTKKFAVEGGREVLVVSRDFVLNHAQASVINVSLTVNAVRIPDLFLILYLDRRFFYFKNFLSGAIYQQASYPSHTEGQKLS